MKVTINPAQRFIVEFDGKEYPCRKANIGELIDLENEMEAAKSNGKPNTFLVMEHLVKLGLPMDVLKALDPDQLNEVSNAFVASKKN